MLVALFWAGAGAFLERTCHRAYLASPLLTSPILANRARESLPVPLRGWVADDPVEVRDRKRFLLRVEEAWWNGTWHPCPGTIHISLREEATKVSLSYGTRLEMPVRLRFARNFGNPGAFDYRRYLEGEGVHLLGSVKSAQLVVRLPGRRGGAGLLVHRLRARLLRRLALAFPDPDEEEPRRFLEAILLGERRGAEGNFERLFRRTGVYHILSISGLHFALLMGGLSRGVRLLPAGRWLAPGILVPAGLLYVLLSGGDDPILRSALASLFIGAGRITGRRISAWDAQAQSGILLLALHPLHLFDPGFQLSFVATLGILGWGSSGWRRLRSLPLVGDPLAVSASAWIVSTPLLAFHFCQASPIALVLNLAAAPFLSGALFLGAFLLVLPCGWMAIVLHLLLAWFSELCRFALKVPGAFVRIPPPAPLTLLTVAVLLLSAGISLPRSRDRLDRRLAHSVAALLILILLAPLPPRPGGRLDCVVLDVGQGDAILLRLPGGENVLVDSGGFTGTDFDVGEKVVLPALLALGVRSLDLVVLTHAHQDHGGGLPAVIDSLPVLALWSGRPPPRSPLLEAIVRQAGTKEVPILHPTRGSRRCLGETCFEVLHPPRNYRSGAEVANDDSLVLRVTYREASLLLTGDIEREGESLVLTSGLPVEAYLLKVCHHGASTSSSDAFLDAVHPSAAVISVGEGNLWGHPSPPVLARLTARKVALHRTDLQGAAWYSFGEGKWTKKPLPE